MVAFNDRRSSDFGVEEILPKVPTERGDSFGKSAIHGRYLIQGIPTDEGRRYVLNEALPNGQVITHDEVYQSRSVARRIAETKEPTRTYDI